MSTNKAASVWALEPVDLGVPEGFDSVARHQWLRECIQRLDEGLRVIEIKEVAETRYAKAHKSDEYVAVRPDNWYQFQAVNVHWWKPGIRGMVVWDADGHLRITDPVPVLMMK